MNPRHDPWRLRCPQGHATVRRRAGKWWCETCSDPRKTGDGPWYEYAIDRKRDRRVSP